VDRLNRNLGHSCGCWLYGGGIELLLLWSFQDVGSRSSLNADVTRLAVLRTLEVNENIIIPYLSTFIPSALSIMSNLSVSGWYLFLIHVTCVYFLTFQIYF
jgi:hypothetical protein